MTETSTSLPLVELLPAAAISVADNPPTRPLRVLFLVSRDILHPANTGGDIGLWERAQYLVSRGHEVVLMGSSFPGAARREVIDGIEVIRTGGLLSMWWRTFLFYMRECRGRFDAVIVEGFGGSRIPRFTPLYVREPIITEWHQIHAALFAVQYPKILGPVLNSLERVTAFVHRNTIVMARTEEWKRAFPQIGFKSENIRVVPACIPESWLLDDIPLKTKPPQVVWLGKFRRYKCPDHAIRAMTDVVRVVPGARLVLAGRHDDLDYEAELMRLANRLGLDSAVEFRFNITEAQKQSLLDSSRALILPSTVEGFGIVVLEANARGLPVVASSGVPTGAVGDDRNGIRHDYGDIHALAHAVTTLMTNDELYSRLSATSLQFAKGFTWRHVSSQYEAVISEVVERAARSTKKRGTARDR